MAFVDDAVLQSYFVYSGLLAIKVLLMVVLTGRVRFAKKVFANPEDAKKYKGVVKLDDPDVERVRRAHRNDLENIPVFWVLGALYATTLPDAWTAVMLFRVFALGRILHTLVYAVTPLPQPARFLAFIVPNAVNWYMGFRVIAFYASAL